MLRKSVFLDVTCCLKHVLGGLLGYGKSPCFSGLCFLGVGSPDWMPLKLLCVDGVKYLE